MKVEQPEVVFKPVTIVLDNRKELNALREALRQAESYDGLEPEAATLLVKLENL